MRHPEGHSRGDAERLDAEDPLAQFRDRFVIPPDSPVYMLGNSLGRLPRDTIDALAHAVQTEWGAGLVGSWEEWMELPFTTGDMLAESVVGASSGEIVLSDSTSVNLYKLACAAIDARPGRTTIITESGNFPTDLYVLEAVAKQKAMRLVRVETPPRQALSDVISGYLDDEVALVALSHVDYRSSTLAPMREINDLAHASGALTLWDLSHSVGVVPVQLNIARTDLAVGCCYKYLNGGPGAPAFIYVDAALQNDLRQPIWGWFGHAEQFAMHPEFRPAAGIARFTVGSPPILAIIAAREGIRMIAEAGLEAIREKSLRQTELAISLFDAWLSDLGLQLITPRDPSRRGSHVSLVHDEAERFSAELLGSGFVTDFRSPNVIRVSVAPLFTLFTEVWDTFDCLREVASE